MDAIYRFDEMALRAALGDLSPRHRTAFALLCATRLAPAFEHATVPRETFASYHEQLWQHLLIDQPALPKVKALRALVESLLPDAEGEAPHAEDAMAALLFAYRCAIGGDPVEASWAAERAYNTLDTYVQDREGLDPRATGGEDAILRHSLIQAEFQRQQQDIRVLRDTSDDNLLRLATLRANAEGARLFG